MGVSKLIRRPILESFYEGSYDFRYISGDPDVFKTPSRSSKRPDSRDSARDQEPCWFAAALKRLIRYMGGTVIFLDL